MKPWVTNALLLTVAVGFGGLGAYFQHLGNKSEGHIHVVVAEAFGTTCVGMGQPYTICGCMLEKARVELSTEEFHKMNLRVFDTKPTEEDTNTFSRWQLECSVEFQEHIREDGFFDANQGMGDMMDAPGLEM